MEPRWTQLLQLIEQRVNRTDYTMWITALDFVAFDGTTLTIAAPSQAFVQTMWPKMGGIIQQAIQQVFGQGSQLRFERKQDADNTRSGQVSVPRGTSASAQGGQSAAGTDAGADGASSPGAIAPGSQQALPPINSNLHRNYTFDNFVEGRSNKTARTMAESIALNPHQTTFNPLFIYGPSGVGKSHLVNALGIRLKERYPNLRVLFVSANIFRTQYTDSIINNTFNDFIHFYQTIDVLIIDDFQEITTARTQMAFFYIFNHLHANNRKIIITCDRPPSLFEGIEERLLSRLKWGAVTEMERPDLKLRLDILHAMMKRHGIELSNDVVKFIADNVSDNVRELEGTINSLMAFSLNDNCDIDLELARRVVARLVGQSRKELTLESIMTAVCEKYHTKARDIIGKSRKRELVGVRQLIMFLAHKYTNLSVSQIGRDIGGRDHSTVLHACDVIDRRLMSDKAYRLEIEKFEATLKK